MAFLRDKVNTFSTVKANQRSFDNSAGRSLYLLFKG